MTDQGLFLAPLDDERVVVPDRITDVLDAAELSFNTTLLLRAFHRLSDEQQLVLGPLHGIAGYQAAPLHQVARDLGLAQASAGRIRDQAKAALAAALVNPFVDRELVAA